MIITDMHTHTNLSGDCTASLEEMVQAAQAKKLTYYAVTDHHDIDYPECGIDFILDLDGSIRQLKEARELYNKPSFTLLRGIEYGLQPHLKDNLAALSQKDDYDFIIGSCHIAGGIDPYEKEFFQGRSRDEAYQFFFENTLECLTLLDGFDALGHLDYAIRYWRKDKHRTYAYNQFKDVLDAILALLIKKDIALEVNTAGYPHKLNQPHPPYDVLTRYLEMGGELLTIGSDAHLPINVATHFDVVEERLKAIGFKSYTTYINRKPLQIGFD